jgi:hypothetical protein
MLFKTPRDLSSIPMLEEMGLRPQTPTIRSSHYGQALRDPWGYFVVQRLGLVPKISWSQCLTLGSWYHTACEHHLNQSPHPWASYRKLIDARLHELAAICTESGYMPTAIEKTAAREEREAYSAWALFHGSAKVPLPSNAMSWLEAIQNKERYIVLATEFEFSMKHPLIQHPVGIRVDAILYHKQHNVLWLVDYKTTSKAPMDRSATCPIEFQTQLYIDVMRLAVEDRSPRIEELLAPLELSKEKRNKLTVQGMQHIIIKKPGIRFGLEDRDFEEKEFIPSRGPNKGVARIEREYVGEPRLSNFVRRVSDWYLRTGMYTHLAEKEPESPVLISNSPASLVLDKNGLHAYYSRLKYLYSLATRLPSPDNFLVNPGASDDHGHISYITDLSVVDIADWPAVISAQGLMVRKPADSIVQLEGQ